MNKKVKEFLRESNAIEGVYGEYELKEAQSAWKHLISQDKLDDLVIKKAHYLLMKNAELPSRSIGYYRQLPVWIGGKEAPNFTAIPNSMAIWFKACNYLPVSKYKDKAKEIKTMHINFEKIHPFIDGNGRIGRMLLNWQRVKLGLPVLVIKESEKQEYYKWFN